MGFIFVSFFPLIPSTFSFLRCRSSWLRILIFPLAPEKDFSVEQGIEQGRRKKKKTMNAILRTSMAFFFPDLGAILLHGMIIWLHIDHSLE